MVPRRVRQAFEDTPIQQWLHLTPASVQCIDELAVQQGRSRAELLREDIGGYLERLQRNETAPPTRYGDDSEQRRQVISALDLRHVKMATRLAKELRVSKSALYREGVRQFLRSQGVEVEP